MAELPSGYRETLIRSIMASGVNREAAEETADGILAERQVRFMLDRQNEAYRHAPCGTWAQRWIPGVCKHSEIRCTHGDEIIGRRFRRRVCMVCGHSLKGPLPDKCFFTGSVHSGGPVVDGDAS